MLLTFDKKTDLAPEYYRYIDIIISIGNYTVREVLMKNRTSVWRNVYNTASAQHERYYKYFAKHK